MTGVEKPLDDLEIMFLEHYGVKGMKWGVRRTQAQLDRAAGRPVSKSSSSSKSSGKANLKSSGNKKASLRSSKPGLVERAARSAAKKMDERRATRAKNKETARKTNRSVRDLSTAELREITNRLELERKFNQLTTPQKQGFKSKVEQFVQYGNLANNVVSTSTTLYKNGRLLSELAKELNKKK